MNVRVIRWLPALGAAALLLAVGPASAQIEANLSSYTGRNAEGYLKPLQEGFGATLQSALFRTAAIPTMGLQVNVGVQMMAVSFSDDDDYFDAETETGFQPASTVKAPTVVGPTEAVTVEGDNNTFAAFPGGLDIGSLAVAVPQLTVSTMGTQALVRYIAFETGDAEVGDVSLIGLGLRHSISQYIPASPVDLAAGITWQSFELGSDLVKATAFTVGAQASKSFSVLEPYAGLSYDSFGMSVEYESEATNPPTRLDVDFDRESSLHFTAGLGLNLAILHLHGEIDVASQTGFAVGVALGN